MLFMLAGEEGLASFRSGGGTVESPIEKLCFSLSTPPRGLPLKSANNAPAVRVPREQSSLLASYSQPKLKPILTDGLKLWLGIRDGNITFQDSLDFDLSEIDSVYDNNEGLAKTMRTY